MNKYFYLLLSVLVILVSSCSDEETLEIDPSVSYDEENVSYGTDTLQSYDLYLPANRSMSTTGTVILIHGGGWAGGDKEDVTGLLDLIQTKMPDYAAINMNYRLTIIPDRPFDQHLEDIDLAILDLSNKRSTYQISDRYALIGVSAGGHLSLLYSYTKNQNSRIKAVGNIVGPTYFLDPSYTMTTDPALQLLQLAVTAATGVPYTNEEFYNTLSPYTVVDQNTIPTIQFFGAEDPIIPTTQGTLLRDRLDEYNIPNELTIYEGEGHGWADLNNWDDTFERFKVFVNQHMD